MLTQLFLLDEFQPDNQSSTDDEETIAQAEEGDSGEHKEEIEALKRESEMNFEDFLSELPKDYLENRDKIKLSDAESDSVRTNNNLPPFHVVHDLTLMIFRNLKTWMQVRKLEVKKI